VDVDEAKLDAIIEEMNAAFTPLPYLAVNVLWLTLVKMANLLPTAGEEHERMASLLRHLPRELVRFVVMDESVERLLTLNPPLETLLTDPRERLFPGKTAEQLQRIRSRRKTDPKGALSSLFEIVQRIRDRREHGFKSIHGPRDLEVLSPTVRILRNLCGVVAEFLSSQPAFHKERVSQGPWGTGA
jgi:hypothetical protein